MFVYISEFGVTDSDARDTFVVKHPYKINFYKTKRVKKCDEFSGPVYGNNFKPFTDLLQERQYSTFAYDLIGDITSCGKIETKEEAHGKLKRFIRIEMQDTMYIPNLYLYSPDALNGLKLSGIPNHRLALKVGAPVMLLRNINQSAGLCNGTRLGITKLGKRFIEAEIITGTKVGEKVILTRMKLSHSEKVILTRMKLSHSDKRIPFKINRRQFPISVCFTMTINKSQGQSLSNVGIFLPKPVFTHGQLYVVVSRVKSRKGLNVLMYDKEGKVCNATMNVVYHECLKKI